MKRTKKKSNSLFNDGNLYYPKFKVILIFTTSSICMSLIVLAYATIEKYANNYKDPSNNYMPKEGYFYNIIPLIIFLLLMVPYNLIFSCIVSFKNLTWENKPWRNVNTYISMMKANMIAGAIIFSPFIILDMSLLSNCIGYFISYSTLNLVISGLILPKILIEK